MKCKKFLAGLLSFTMIATTFATPLGDSISGIFDNFSISADAAVSGDYEYSILGNGTVKITKYNGSAQKLSIPAKIAGKNVTVIGKSAFEDCNTITDVTIPNGVTTIEECAFWVCENLKSVSMPNSLTSIGAAAFNWCSNITSLKIPDSVNNIGARAFWRCTGLSEINIPKSLKTIDAGVFSVCNSLKSMTIPNHITSIGEEAFSYCENLEKVVIPDSVTTIKEKAFEGCRALTQVNIPSKIKVIQDGVFDSCESLKSITIPYGVTEIGWGAFASSGLESLVIPDSVTVICEEAFSFSSLSQVTLSKNLKEIRSWAFKGTCIKSIKIPEGITSIQHATFDYCGYLTDVSLPSTLTEIQWEAFQDCTFLDNVTIPNSVKKLGKSIFERCGSLKNVTLPNTITEIPDRMFYECSSLQKIVIPDTVTKIGDYAFNQCYRLTDVTMPSKLKSIGDGVFYQCVDLSDLTLADSVEYVGGSTFAETNLSNVHFPSNVKSVGVNPFADTPYAKNNIYNNGLYWGNWLVGYNKKYDQDATYVVIKKGTEHIADSTFSQFYIKGKLTIPDGIKTIGEGAFAYNSFDEIVMPDSVTYVGEAAFANSYNLKKIVLSKNLSSIEYLTFSHCYELRDVTIPDSVKYVASLAFFDSAIEKEQKTNIKYVSNWIVSADNVPDTLTIKDGIVGIAENVFVGKPYEITIPKSVKYFAPYAVGYSSIGSWVSKIKNFKLNCYSGSAAEQFAKDNGLNYTLLDGSAHTHSYTSKITKAATCTANGIKTFTCKCGNSYTQVIKATGHKYQTTVVSPTYLVEGYTLHKCSACGDSYKDTITAVKKVPVISGAKATGTTYNSIKLSWNKTSGVNGYIVYRYNSARKSWIRLAKISNPNTTSYTATGLSSAAEYQIAVKGYATENGKEIGSPKLSLIKATTNPGVVSNFKASGYTTNSVKLTWNKVNGAEGYIVYRYNPSNKGWIRLTKTKGTSYTATGLASGTSYKFAVKSYITLNGKEFGGSQLTQVFTSTNPDKVNFTVTSPSAGRADFRWSKVRGATGYIVYYKENAKDSWHRLTVTSGTSYTKTGLKRGNNYIFTVKAYKTTGGVTYNGAFVNKTLKIK